MMSVKIAICISTYNRPKLFRECYDSWKKNLPPNGRIFVVDDASPTDYARADHRFTENVGIATVKNKCLELAYEWGADFFFLVDDDVICINPDFYKYYINSGEDHLQHIFSKGGKWKTPDLTVVGKVDNLVGYSNTRGVMLFMTRKCVDTIGGFHRFSRYGGEHRDYSIRAFNAGLSTFKYGDVKNSSNLFDAKDRYGKPISTISKAERKEYIKNNREELRSRRNSTQYEPFR